MSVVPDEFMQIDEVELYIGIVVIDDLLNGHVHFLEIAPLFQPAMHDELQQQVLHLLLHAVRALPLPWPQVFFGGDPQKDVFDQFIIRREVIFVTDYLSDIDELIDDDLVLKGKQSFVGRSEEVAEVPALASGPQEGVGVGLEEVGDMREDHIDQICLGLCLEVIQLGGWVEQLGDELREEVDCGLETSQSCLFKYDVQIVLAVFNRPQDHLKLHLPIVPCPVPGLIRHVPLSLQRHPSPPIQIKRRPVPPLPSLQCFFLSVEQKFGPPLAEVFLLELFAQVLVNLIQLLSHYKKIQARGKEVNGTVGWDVKCNGLQMCDSLSETRSGEREKGKEGVDIWVLFHN